MYITQNEKTDRLEDQEERGGKAKRRTDRLEEEEERQREEDSAGKNEDENVTMMNKYYTRED